MMRIMLCMAADKQFGGKQMKKLLRQATAMIAIIALAVTLISPSALAESKSSFVCSQIDYRPAKLYSESELGIEEDSRGIEIVPHKTENPKRSEIWDGSIATGFAGGTGTEEDPYLISDGSELAYLAQEVNGRNDYSDVYFKLTNDIYLNDTNGWESWGDSETPQNEWTAIGRYNIYEDEYPIAFNGCFDGDGYAVHGIYINNQEDYQGLFGYTGSDSVIANLGVTESYVCGYGCVGGVVGVNYDGNVINCYNMGIISGEEGIGGVVGFNDGGHVTDCHNAGSISGNYAGIGGVVGANNYYVENCYNTGYVTCEYGAGGVVGNNGGIVSVCYNTGSINGEDTIGGVVGENSEGTVANCYNIGVIIGDYNVGGVVGENDSGTVTDCYNTSSVTGDEYIGGVIGYSFGWYDDEIDVYFNATVTNCYNVGSVSGNSDFGGVIGWYEDCTVTNCYYFVDCCTSVDSIGTALTSEQLLLAESFEGFDFNSVWTMDGNPDYPYPELTSNIHGGMPVVTTKPGDANGDGKITIADATLISRMALNLTESVPAADFNGDGSINMADATLTARKALNLI